MPDTTDTDLLDNMDLDSLLDTSLDEFEDLKDFAPYPIGTHRVLGTLELKEINGKPNIEFSMKAVETLELKDSVNDKPLTEGDVGNTLYSLTSEFGRGAFKKNFAQASAVLGTSTTRELIEQFTELECLVVTGQRKDKNDKEKIYTVIKELAIPQ